MSILRLNEFKALPGKFEQLTALFEGVVAGIRNHPGCQRCELLIKVADGANDDEKLIVLEVWDSVEAHKAALAGMTPEDFAPAMALLSGRPAGQYYAAVEG